jgi:hypothetical protein
MADSQLSTDSETVTGTQLMQLLSQLIPNMDWGGGVLTLSGAGRVTFTNVLGTNNVVFTFSVGSSNSKYGLQLISVTSTTVTLQVVDTTTGGAGASGQTVGVNWIGVAN